MYKSFLFFILLLLTFSGKAHQSDISTTMLLQRDNNSWVLQISASLTAFQHEIKTHFSETPYQSPEEFQELVLSHIKNNFEVVFNSGTTVSLRNGFVQLGHETKVLFEVLGVPETINFASVTNTAFKDIHRNQSALMIVKNGFDKNRFILSEGNNHSLKLAVVDGKFVDLSINEASTVPFKTIAIFAGAFLLLVFLIHYVNRQNSLSDMDLLNA